MGQQAQLFVWTDIDPAFEADFNRWYDREHMAERMALPGFRWARRYRAVSGRRYLALYRTDSLEAFTSPAYKDAFANQTAWSKRNFARMRNPMRRVGAIAAERGRGAGGAIAMVTLGPDGPEMRTIEHLFGNCMTIDGILGGHLLVPDATLSTPLPNEVTTERDLDPIFILEATSEAAAAKVGAMAARELACPDGALTILSLMWELSA